MKIYSTMKTSDGREEISELQVIVKWGGVLTSLGADQAKSLGHQMRSTSYPGASLGFLRLHSTYRHDLKIYMSDEGRVQVRCIEMMKNSRCSGECLFDRELWRICADDGSCIHKRIFAVGRRPTTYSGVALPACARAVGHNRQ